MFIVKLNYILFAGFIFYFDRFFILLSSLFHIRIFLVSLYKDTCYVIFIIVH